MKIYLFILIVLFVGHTAAAQTAMFEPGNISAGDVFGVTFSPDEREVYFVKSYGGRDKLELMFAKKENGKWSAPKLLFPADAYKYIDPFVTPDGKLLLFNTNRPKPNSTETKDFHIWAMRKIADGWGEPFYLGDVVNSDSSDFYATADQRGNLYFTSRRTDGGALGGNDIWLSEFKRGAYSPPKNLGSPINSKDSESNPFVSPKGDYLIYFSNREGGAGDSDLYVTFKKADGNWTTPQNLGTEINTEIGEFTPLVSKNGKRLYFSRLKREDKLFVENIYYYDNSDKLLKKLRKSSR